MKKLFAIAAAICALSAPAAGYAHDAVLAAYEQAKPLSQILAQIARSTPGRHLNTTQGEAGGRPVYFVQWQTSDGRVMVFVVDAASGQIIGRQGG